MERKRGPIKPGIPLLQRPPEPLGVEEGEAEKRRGLGERSLRRGGSQVPRISKSMKTSFPKKDRTIIGDTDQRKEKKKELEKRGKMRGE